MSNISAPEATQPGIGIQVYNRLNMAWNYMTSYYKSRTDQALFQDVKTYCTFIGYARSGHSIIGALLDAHPNIILPDEVDALQYVSAGFSREQIFHLLLANSRSQLKHGRTKKGRNGKVYSYLVPGQWQGRFDRLTVIGDSKAGGSTRRFAADPSLLQQLQHTMAGLNVKFILVVRNPFDNISTLSIRGRRTLEAAIERYFFNCAAIADFCKRTDRSDLLVVRQEDLIDHPQASLAGMCEFLGVPAPQSYLDACASILYRSPAKSRHSVEWSQESIDIVRRKMDQFDFLASYSYEQ